MWRKVLTTDATASVAVEELDPEAMTPAHESVGRKGPVGQG